MVNIVHRPRQPEAEKNLLAVGVPDLMARLLAARGVDTPETLENSLAHLLPPDSLLNNKKMAVLLADAIEAQQKILIVGDYLRA